MKSIIRSRQVVLYMVSLQVMFAVQPSDAATTRNAEAHHKVLIAQRGRGQRGPSREELLRKYAVFKQVEGLLKANDYPRAIMVMYSQMTAYPQFKTALGLIYLTGEGGTKKNIPYALKLLEDAAVNHADLDARRNLAAAYFEGNVGKKDYAKARAWAESCGMDAKAQLILGQIYYEGLGTPKDYQKAVTALKRADSAGESEARAVIGLIYSKGGHGIEKNVAEGSRWLEATARGTPKLYFTLGNIFMTGDGVPVDLAKGLGYYRQAQTAFEAEMKKKPTDEAKLGLATCYELGVSGKPNYEEARKLFESMGENAQAFCGLGSLHSHGFGGFPADEKKAIQHYLRAAKLGSKNAKANLGEDYFLGRGVEKNLVEAKKWLDEAAAEEDAVACYYLGVMHATGQGVPKDENKARNYFKRARPDIEWAVAFEVNCGADFENKRYFDSMNTEFKELAPPREQTAAATAKIEWPPKETQPVAIAAPSTPPPRSSSGGEQTAVTQSTPASTPSSAPASAPREPIETNAFFLEAESLVKKYYPRAVISKTPEKIHFEFKTQKWASPQNPNKHTLVPKLDGIIGELKVQPGHYAGRLKLPHQTNESLYESLVMAPYSTSKNCHLMSELMFPSNVSMEFISEYKTLLDRFE